jgi:hypothetical protein
MTNEIPDLREFCFSTEAPASPDIMMAVWAKNYLTPEQFKEFKRMIHEIAVESPRGRASVEQMIGIVDMARLLAS